MQRFFMILYTNKLLETRGIILILLSLRFGLSLFFTIITIITVSHIYISVAAFSPTKKYVQQFK